MSALQVWGMAFIMMSVTAAIYARNNAPLEPRLPKPMTRLEALVATFVLYGGLIIGLTLFFFPSMVW